jgi:Rrf2 family protein
MTLLPSRGLLAVAAVIDIALNARAAPVAAKALAARHGLTPRHLETLLQDLVRAAILKAYRGPRGGYELAKERRRISVGDIVRAAIRGPEVGAKPKKKPRIVTEVIEPALAPASAGFLEELDRITIDELCGRAETSALALAAGLDFTI